MNGVGGEEVFQGAQGVEFFEGAMVLWYNGILATKIGQFSFV